METMREKSEYRILVVEDDSLRTDRFRLELEGYTVDFGLSRIMARYSDASIRISMTHTDGVACAAAIAE